VGVDSAIIVDEVRLILRDDLQQMSASILRIQLDVGRL
jgi:hypothetical protein